MGSVNSSPARKGHDHFLSDWQVGLIVRIPKIAKSERKESCYLNFENLESPKYILFAIAVTGNSDAAERDDLHKREQRATDLQPAGPDGTWPRHDPRRALWYLRPATTHLMGAPRREPGGSATGCRTYGVLPTPVSLCLPCYYRILLLICQFKCNKLLHLNR